MYSGSGVYTLGKNPAQKFIFVDCMYGSLGGVYKLFSWNGTQYQEFPEPFENEEYVDLQVIEDSKTGQNVLLLTHRDETPDVYGYEKGKLFLRNKDFPEYYQNKDGYLQLPQELSPSQKMRYELKRFLDLGQYEECLNEGHTILNDTPVVPSVRRYDDGWDRKVNEGKALANSDVFSIHLLLATALMELNRESEAIVEFSQASDNESKFNPNSGVGTSRFMGDYWFHKGGYEKAGEYYQKGILECEKAEAQRRKGMESRLTQLNKKYFPLYDGVIKQLNEKHEKIASFLQKSH